MATDYTNITGKATVQVETSSEVSSGNSIANQVSAIIQADAQQKAASEALSSAQQQINDLANSVSGMCQPIFDSIQEFKLVPSKIRSVVDVEGAANGMYDNISKCSQSLQSLSSVIISVEVPITVEDYYADPYKYENLLAIEYKNNCVTEEDCLSSGYTKVAYTVDPVWFKKLVDQFTPPEDRDVVGKSMEKVIGGAVKTAWTTIQTPIQTIASIAPLGPISDMVTSVTDAVDNVAQIASKTVPEEKLNQMVAEKQVAAEKALDDAKAAIAQPNPAGVSASDLASQTTQQASSAISSVTSGVSDSVDKAFENLPAPELPDEVKHTVEDLKDSITMVKDNISNIYIVVLLKMMNSVFDCFNQIIGAIGVPSIPDPLGKIPQVTSDMTNVMNFVQGLPTSMVKTTESIVKRKMKMVQVGMTPVPPKPVQTLTPVPPTSKDVVKPDTTWDDSVDKLINEYNFSKLDAKKIVECLSSFYDGSDSEGFSTGVINGSTEKWNSYGLIDWVPTFKFIRRYKLEPLECFEKYIPTNVMENMGQFLIEVPKLNNGPDHTYYKYSGRESSDKEYISYKNAPAIETYFSQRST